MRFILSLALFVALYGTSCYDTAQDAKTDSLLIQEPWPASQWPEVAVYISMDDSVYTFGDSIFVDIQLTNKADKTQKVLFEEPKLCTGGPWHTVATITDVATGKSVVKIANKSLLCSQSYGAAELEQYYHVLYPGNSIQGRFELNNLVTFDTEGYDLHPGTYEMWIACSSSSPSNVIRFSVR